MTRYKGLAIFTAAIGLMGFSIGPAGAAETGNPFEKAIEDRFNSMDANKDGNISYDEYEASYQKSIKNSFERRDQNRDGALSKDEFMPKMRQAGPKGTSNPFQQMMKKQKAAGAQEQKAAAEEKPVEQTR